MGSSVGRRAPWASRSQSCVGVVGASAVLGARVERLRRGPGPGAAVKGSPLVNMFRCCCCFQEEEDAESSGWSFSSGCRSSACGFPISITIVRRSRCDPAVRVSSPWLVSSSPSRVALQRSSRSFLNRSRSAGATPARTAASGAPSTRTMSRGCGRSPPARGCDFRAPCRFPVGCRSGSR